MLTARQVCLGIVGADVLLFVLASAFNDHSNTSADGFLWWAAIAVFLVLIAIAAYIFGSFLWGRWQKRNRTSWRSRRSG